MQDAGAGAGAGGRRKEEGGQMHRQEKREEDGEGGNREDDRGIGKSGTPSSRGAGGLSSFHFEKLRMKGVNQM